VEAQGVSKLQFFIIKRNTNFSAVFFFLNFWSSNPWIRIRIHLTCWIQHLTLGKKVWEKFFEYLIGDRRLDLVEECRELLVRESGDTEEMQHLTD
jgi:hypothetical protein